ncbi:WD repeat containing protein [Neofusicoccum parvum]|uniref:WD repeat containing protein n=1 Tax=Neofusicoccum parvum TaxID=310453 RepID=A0ACB5RUM7_9PEZI|nr:WD repeat containing protein [Neofusicoccum parvum]
MGTDMGMSKYDKRLNTFGSAGHQRSRTFDGDLSTSAPEKSSVTWGPNTVYGGASTGSNASSSHRSNSHKRSRTGIQTTTEQQQQQQQQRFVSFDSIDEDGVDDPGFSDDEDFYPNFDDDKTDVAPVDRSAGGNVIHVTLKNQDQFDDDGHLSVALLDQEQQWMYAAYRASYANNELAGWGLQVKRSEVLKYNGLTSYWVKDEADENHGEDLAVGRSQESIGARSSTIAPDDLILCPLPLHLISTPTTSGPNTTSTTARSSATHTRTHTPDPHTLLNASAAAFAPNANHYHPLTHHPSTTLYATNPTPTPAPTRPPSTKSASPPNEKTPPEEDDDVSIGGANGVAQGAAARTRTCMVCWLQLDGLYRTCAECGHAVHAECGGGRGDGLMGGECWYCGG